MGPQASPALRGAEPEGTRGRAGRSNRIMSPSDPPGEPAGGQAPEALSEVGAYPTAADGFDHGLVILAMGRPYWLMPAGDQYRLLIEAAAADEAREQLASFDRESSQWPPRPAAATAPARRLELATPLFWGLAVSAVYWDQLQWPGHWEKLGALNAPAVLDRGEWWRLATALFLHADLGHLLSNLLSGIFVFASVLTTFGRRRGWILLALASVAGNFFAVVLHRSGAYSSLGASTAIFAGLGLLTGRAVSFSPRADHPHRWREMLVPLAAGTALLALYGAGGPQVDVVAHVTGFAAGLAFGFLSAVLTQPGQRIKAPR